VDTDLSLWTRAKNGIAVLPCSETTASDRRSVLTVALQMLVVRLVLSRLDFCSGLVGIPA